MEKITVSSLGKTWILDLDGTIVKHNGYKIDGIDTLLENAKEFLNNIPKEDMIIFITSRTQQCKKSTEDFLKKEGIHYHDVGVKTINKFAPIPIVS